MASSIIDFTLFSFLDEVEGLPTFETVGVDGGGVKVELKRQINIVIFFIWQHITRNALVFSIFKNQSVPFTNVYMGQPQNK